MLAVASQNAVWAQRFLEMHRQKGMTAEEIAAERQVVDLDGSEVECPACQAQFDPRGQTHCPECGLRLAVE